MSLTDARIVALARCVGAILGVAAALIMPAADPAIVRTDPVVAPRRVVGLAPAVAPIGLMRPPTLVTVDRVMGPIAEVAGPRAM